MRKMIQMTFQRRMKMMMMKNKLWVPRETEILNYFHPSVSCFLSRSRTKQKHGSCCNGIIFDTVSSLFVCWRFLSGNRHSELQKQRVIIFFCLYLWRKRTKHSLFFISDIFSFDVALIIFFFYVCTVRRKSLQKRQVFKAFCLLFIWANFDLAGCFWLLMYAFVDTEYWEGN